MQYTVYFTDLKLDIDSIDTVKCLLCSPQLRWIAGKGPGRVNPNTT